MLACLAAQSAQAEWKPAERIDTYAISGKTGIELYQSIGERGPKSGQTRAIAHTTFDLKWSRKYEPMQDGSCRLTTARPHLTIIYRLPKPSSKLPPDTQKLWDRFIDGITAHERVHGEHILDMVRKIEAFSVGFTVPDDSGCKKIRQELTKRLSELSQEQRATSRDFDRIEMQDGGNVHQLILGLVNGG
jgi:predicted secreted Zn-dependent protease